MELVYKLELTQEDKDALASGETVPYQRSPNDPTQWCCGNPNVWLVKRGPHIGARCAVCNTLSPKWVKRDQVGLPTRSISSSKISPWMRATILMYAKGRCQLCAIHIDLITELDGLVVDHMISQKACNRHGWDWLDMESNLAALCPECNSGKSSRSMPIDHIESVLHKREKEVPAVMLEAIKVLDDEGEWKGME